MDDASQNYLMVLLVAAYRIDDGHFAVESAFATHLRLYRPRIAGIAMGVVLASPSMSAETYDRTKERLAVIDEAAEGVRFVPMYPSEIGRLAYYRQLPSIAWRLFKEVKAAKIVHAGPSQLSRLFEFLALPMGWVLGKTTVSHTDIDNRQSAWMSYKSGYFSRRVYWTARLLHNPAVHIQQLFCARACSLDLLKGVKFAAEYGGGRPNVKSFLDSAFSAGDIIPPARLARKMAELADDNTPVDIVFFGRLVDYKGVDHMLRALAHAKSLGLRAFRFHVVGDGDARRKLGLLATELGLGAEVTFYGALPFNAAFFSLLYEYHILLAAPLSQDTPRSALDAAASGQAIVAYDTDYYKELRDAGSGVDVVPWGDVAALGRTICALGQDRIRLTRMIEQAVGFARANTQEIWLDRRLHWIREAMAAQARPQPRLAPDT